MNATLNAFKAQRFRDLDILRDLQSFLQAGATAGVPIDDGLMRKLETAMRSLGEGKLQIALVGGFSEGKTSIAAAWLERLDRSSMKISHEESSNEVRVYAAGPDLLLIDTPGLFGFKEEFDAQSNVIEKYKDITRKYVSEAHLLLYVMNSTNALKESHQEDLRWLFRTLDLLPRTIFVLSRFDEVADVEDEEAYQEHFAVKRAAVVKRLENLIDLTPEETETLSVVAVAANPFDMGVEHWLENPEQFKALSHIGLLQQATSAKIVENGGVSAIVAETRKSVIREVIAKQLPLAIKQDEKISREVDKIEKTSRQLQEQLALKMTEINAIRRRLRDFVSAFFPDLLIQIKGSSQETFPALFEREIGAEGVVLSSRLHNMFESQLNSLNLELNKLKISMDAEITHYDSTMEDLTRKGFRFASKVKLDGAAVLAARNGFRSIAGGLGVDFGKALNFRPYGAVNLASKLNGAIAVVGLAVELWSAQQAQEREEAFQKCLQELAQELEALRADLLRQINGDDFIMKFFEGYISLAAQAQEIDKHIEEQRQRSEKFKAWRMQGENIAKEFANLGRMEGFAAG